MPSKSKVSFFFEKQDFVLADRSKLKRFLESIFRREKTNLKFLNYIFCSDKRLLEINRKFLKHDYYTDIISFDLGENGSVEGEIYISVDRVRENSKLLEIPFKSEIHRVIFHGALHLCGYGDENISERHLIRKKEGYYLDSYFK